MYKEIDARIHHDDVYWVREIYLLLTELEIFTESYGSIYGPHASEKTRGSVTRSWD